MTSDFLRRTEDIDKVQWLPSGSLSCEDCSAPIASPENTTTYQVIIVDSNGCQFFGYVTVTIIEPSIDNEDTLYDPDIFIPNAFSPNGDHLNNVFGKLSTQHELFKLTIWNNRGEKVFASESNQINWDGTIKNAETISGATYFYIPLNSVQKARYFTEVGM